MTSVCLTRVLHMSKLSADEPTALVDKQIIYIVGSQMNAATTYMGYADIITAQLWAIPPCKGFSSVCRHSAMHGPLFSMAQHWHDVARHRHDIELCTAVP